jgi:hypothetical protein
MRKKSNHHRRRGRRAGILTTFAALVSMLVASVGAAPAQAQTQTAWIPLACHVAVTPTFGFDAKVAAALKATFPDQVAPGDEFSLTGISTIVIFPPNSQIQAGALQADGTQGYVQEFWTQTTNATSAFQTTDGGNPVNSSPTLFNAVGTAQSPNITGSPGGETFGPEVHGGDTSRAGFPAGWTVGGGAPHAAGTPDETFSFGDIPGDPSGGSGTSFGPAPGHGGAFGDPSGGTPVALPPIGPITVTGADGQNVVLKNVNGPGGNVAVNVVSFHTTANTYTSPLQANCAIDTDGTGDNEQPATGFVNQFTIPIVAGPPEDGVGSASARGTDPDATLGAGTVAAQFSAISNCDETQVKPFYVRWTSGSTTNTFKKTGASTTSDCFSSGGANINEGTGTGTINGAGSANVSWHFADGGGPDDVQITVTPSAGDPLNISATPPAALSGTPGGVWVSGTLPWPAGGGT